MLMNAWNYKLNHHFIRLGCSAVIFPNKYNNVKRHLKIELQHQIKARNDNDGNMFIKEVFTGFNACIIQHEMDHLNGIHIFNK